jgi:hypothetical protein
MSLRRPSFVGKRRDLACAPPAVVVGHDRPRYVIVINPPVSIFASVVVVVVVSISIAIPNAIDIVIY